MKTREIIGAMALAICVALPFAVAQEESRQRPERPIQPEVRDMAGEREMTPEERERMREEARMRGEAAREGAEGRVAPGAPAGQRGGFLINFLNQQPEYREAVQAHNEKMQEIQQQLAEFRRETVEKIRAVGSPDARRAAIAKARENTAELIQQLVDEAIRHHEEIAEMTKANRDKIIEHALDNIYGGVGPREREDRPMRGVLE